MLRLDQVRQGLRPLPDPIANAPQLRQGLELYYRAFMELSTCRAIGMAMGPIPWTAVERYADREGLVGDDYEQFVVLVRMMDVAYLEYQAEQAKNK